VENKTPILELLNISKRFPGVIALNDVTLTVDTGEIVALIGENGAGKSTLMKILGGAISRDSGTVKIEGQPAEIKSPREASALGIEFIHQELSVLDNLDVAANIFLRREPTKAGPLKLIDRPRLYREADALLAKLGLDLPSRTSLSRLSLAQHQLVEIARAIARFEPVTVGVSRAFFEPARTATIPSVTTSDELLPANASPRLRLWHVEPDITSNPVVGRFA